SKADGLRRTLTPRAGHSPGLAGGTMGAGTGGVRIGCAGWSIPGRHAALFGAGDSALARYATRFDVVEVNSSFYRPHQHATWRRWAAAVPRRSEEHTSELQSRENLVCRLLLEKKN